MSSLQSALQSAVRTLRRADLTWWPRVRGLPHPALQMGGRGAEGEGGQMLPESLSHRPESLPALLHCSRLSLIARPVCPPMKRVTLFRPFPVPQAASLDSGAPVGLLSVWSLSGRLLCFWQSLLLSLKHLSSSAAVCRAFGSLLHRCL